MNLESTLTLLTKKSLEAEKHYGQLRERDTVNHLTAEKSQGWCRLLSSVLSAETLEKTLILPLIDTFKDEPVIQNFFKSQSSDEQRHQDMLAWYLLKTFNFQRKKKTLANRIFMDGFIGPLSLMIRHRPLLGIVFLHLYEDYGNTFYGIIRAQAKKDNLEGLLRMLKVIEQDERRHSAGLESMIHYIFESRGLPPKWELFLVKSALKYFALDANLSRWAFYNRDVRRAVSQIELNPDELTQIVRKTVANSIAHMGATYRELKAQ